MRCAALIACLLAPAAAFSPTLSRGSVRRGTRGRVSMETFNFLPGEDPVANTDPQILGEVNYKNFVEKKGGVDSPLLTRGYPVLERVQELKLLSKTADSGLLSSLEAQGLTLSKLEKVLPLAEELGLLELAAKNSDFLINGVAPLAVEPAPALLPLLSNVVGVPGGTFKGVAALAILAEGALIATSDNIALDVAAGLPLFLIGGVCFALGNALDALK